MTRDTLPTLDSSDSQPETQAAPRQYISDPVQAAELVDLGDGNGAVDVSEFNLETEAPAPDTIRMTDVTPDFDFRAATPTCCTQHAAYGMDRNPCGITLLPRKKSDALYHTTQHQDYKFPDTRKILSSILERRPLPVPTPLPRRYSLSAIEEICSGSRYGRDTEDATLRRVESIDEAVLLLPATATIPTHAVGFQLKNSTGLTFTQWLERVGGAQKMAGLDAERAWHDGEEPEDYL